MKNYSAAGDPPLRTTAVISLQEPLILDRTIARGLKRREINVKEAFTIADSSGAFFRASLKELGPHSGVALPYEKMTRSPEPSISITLACSVLARQRMLFVMQKATELGVSRIVPLLTEHSVPTSQLEHEKASAWPGQILRAARQCRRSSLPHLDPPTELCSFLNSESYRSAQLSLLLDDHSAPHPLPPETIKDVVLIVGPEGGFADSERVLLAKSAHAWVLGGRVLRAETAVVVGLTGVQIRFGDFV
jgi:16S rRNA (uracil1498-N3)-methyltransferase